MSVLTGDERYGGFSPRADKREDERQFAGTLSTSSSGSRGESFQLCRAAQAKSEKSQRRIKRCDSFAHYVVWRLK